LTKAWRALFCDFLFPDSLPHALDGRAFDRFDEALFYSMCTLLLLLLAHVVFYVLLTLVMLPVEFCEALFLGRLRDGMVVVLRIRGPDEHTLQWKTVYATQIRPLLIIITLCFCFRSIAAPHGYLLSRNGGVLQAPPVPR